MVVALDSGAVEFYSLSYSDEEDGEPGFHFLERTASVQEHDDLITALRFVVPSSSSSSPARTILTASHDRSVCALDASTLALVRRFERAHADVVLDVDPCRAGRTDVFATAAMDGKVALWDLREASCKNCEPSRNVFINVHVKNNGQMIPLSPPQVSSPPPAFLPRAFNGRPTARSASSWATSPARSTRWTPGRRGNRSPQSRSHNKRSRRYGSPPTGRQKISRFVALGSRISSSLRPDLFATVGDARTLRIFSFDGQSTIKMR